MTGVVFTCTPSIPHEGFAPVKDAELYDREVGQGQPIIVIHGGPDFDRTYLPPDMDRLFDAYHPKDSEDASQEKKIVTSLTRPHKGINQPSPKGEARQAGECIASHGQLNPVRGNS
jgi:hypothetical protein